MLMFGLAEAAATLFQIRPAKDFVPAKGYDRLLSLSFLSELPAEGDNLSSHSSSDAPSNAYDFMQRRQEANGHPLLKKWNANIRIGNFASLEKAPLCVGYMLSKLYSLRTLTARISYPLSVLYWIISRNSVR